MKPFPENMNPDLLIAFLNNETTPEQDVLVREWIDASEENRKQYEAIRTIWENAAESLPSSDANVDRAWGKLSDRISQSENQGRTVPFKKIRFRRVMVAAGLIPLLLLAIWFLLREPAPVMITARTDNEKKEITLSDGSHIVLNANSQLTYPDEFDGSNRQVSLVGEAFFTVIHNVEQPFIVNTGKSYVRVTGTSFNVNTRAADKQVEVYVKTGKVYLVNSDKTDSIALNPGNKGVFVEETNKVQLDTTASENDLFWMNKTLTYQNTPLKVVFDEIRKYYNVTIEVEDASIEELRLTTNFSDQTAGEVLEVIALSFNLRVEKNGTKYRISFNE